MGLAMRNVKVIYPNAGDIGCTSHTLDIVGHKFEVPTFFHLVELIVYPQSEGENIGERANRSSYVILQ